ncbi:unnamed protein product, partial [Heterosigma akashiwo]
PRPSTGWGSTWTRASGCRTGRGARCPPPRSATQRLTRTVLSSFSSRWQQRTPTIQAGTSLSSLMWRPRVQEGRHPH